MYFSLLPITAAIWSLLKVHSAYREKSVADLPVLISESIHCVEQTDSGQTGGIGEYLSLCVLDDCWFIARPVSGGGKQRDIFMGGWMGGGGTMSMSAFNERRERRDDSVASHSLSLFGVMMQAMNPFPWIIASLSSLHTWISRLAQPSRTRGSFLLRAEQF